MSEFATLVLDKLRLYPDHGTESCARLQRNFEFCPMLKDVQTCSNKSYFFDALIIHALELNTEPITGKALKIAEPVLNRVLKESNFDLNTAI